MMMTGFGHKWPSTTGNDDGPATYLDASTLIMDFFARCSLATDPGTPSKSCSLLVVVLPSANRKDSEARS